MPNIEYNLRGRVYEWQGKGAWHFVNLSKKQSKEIKNLHGDLTGGFGSIRVEVSLGSTTWKTSIFPSKEGYYLLPLKAAVRKAEGVAAGDIISYTLNIGL